MFLFQMTECSQQFRSLGERYAQLYHSSFNADPVSLQNIEVYPFFMRDFHNRYFPKSN